MSFSDSVCCISGLPIQYGDAVRWFLVTESQCADLLFIPRTIPISAVYEEYGTLMDVKTGVLTDIVLEGFRLDAIGESPQNSWRAGIERMSFSDLVWDATAGLISVFDDVNYEERKAYEQKAGAEYLPTEQRVCEILQGAGLDKDATFVNEVRAGWIRVQIDVPYGTDAMAVLRTARAALEPYFGVALTAPSHTGSGVLPRGELRVFMAPHQDVQGAPVSDAFSAPRAPPLAKVLPAMVREDVWQAILSLSVLKDAETPVIRTIGDFRQEVRGLFEKGAEVLSWVASFPAAARDLMFHTHIHTGANAIDPALTHFVLPGYVTVLTHIELLGKRAPDDATIDAIAEFWFICAFAARIGYQFTPSRRLSLEFNAGTYSRFLREVLALADAHAKQEAEDTEDTEDIEEEE